MASVSGMTKPDNLLTGFILLLIVEKRSGNLDHRLNFAICVVNEACRGCFYRHCRPAADLPAKVVKRIGCAHIRCSFKIEWSRIFGRILGHKFLVIILGHKFLVDFYVTFPYKTTYFA